MKKKIVLGMLIVLSLLVLAVPAFALTEGDWEFQLLDNEVMITGYLGNDVDVVVPDTIYGFPVTSMEMNEEKNLRNARSVKFPANLKVVNNTIFHKWGYGTDLLETVILPEGLNEIGSLAFYSCPKLKNVNIPSTVKSIGGQALQGTAVVSVEIPTGVENIGEWAFADCKSLKKINISENIKSIGQCCFAGSGIVEIYLPYAEELGGGAFINCSDLQSITIASGYKSLPDRDTDGMFENCVSLTEIHLPNTIETIEWACFKNCHSLSQIILPTSLKEIHWEAFSGTSIKEIIVPYGTESIGYAAFGYNSNLQSLYIPDTISEIDYRLLEESPNCVIYCSEGSKMADMCKQYKISYLTDKSVNSGITVLYNGTRISFHKYDQNPELINSRTLVPLRAIFEAMDAEVTWDEATQTAVSTRDGITIKIQIGADNMYKDGQSIPVDVPAQLLNDRTMVPIRVIAEAFGADVQWNDAGRTVLITE